MERTLSVEEKIRRAEEIYNRRQQVNTKHEVARVNVQEKKNYKLFKKMIWQIIICLSIYSIFYLCSTKNYMFSEDLKNSVSGVLNKDLNFQEIYNNVKNKYYEITKTEKNKDNENMENSIENQNSEETKNTEENQNDENIGGAEDEKEQTNETTEEVAKELTQMEQDAVDIKNSISFIVPVQGTISSTFGWRNPTTSTVPKYHTGLDIAAVTGTKIKSATSGTVILKSSEGDYGNHLKIQIDDVVIVYAHCKTLYVNEGDKIEQGQEIAEVGTTGNSTGPHLHFEIRKQDRLVDPQLIIQI